MIKRPSKRTLALVCAGCLVILGGLLMVGGRRYSAFFEQKLVSSARANGLLLSFEDFNLSPTALRAKTARSWLRAGPLPLQLALSTVIVKPLLFDIVKLKPGATLEGALYGGGLYARANQALFSDDTHLTLTLTGARLFEHPQLRAFGITQGTLNMDIKDMFVAKQRIQSGRFKMDLSALAKPKPTVLSAKLTGLPLDLTLPPIEKGYVRTSAIIRDGEHIEIEDLSSGSSLGAMEGKGSAKIGSNGRISEVEIDFKSALTNKGIAEWGAFLPLVSGGKLQTDDRKFLLKVRGNPEAPKLTWERR